jgi:hypothetical protein
MKKHVLIFLLMGFVLVGRAQGLLDELDKQDSATVKKSVREKVYDIFFGTRLINGHSIETNPKGTFAFLIAHRFGRVNSGFFQFFGLDQASVRFGFEYAILDNLQVGFGRSTYRATWDGFVKYRFLEQTSGKRQIPLSLAAFVSASLDGRKYLYPDQRTTPFSQRMAYTYQLLIARKMTKWLSVQLMPTLVHRNFVESSKDKNLLFVPGIGARFRVSPSVAILGEYYYRVGDSPDNGYRNSAAIGVDINTGGHVFQIQLTNSQAMFESAFLRQTTGNILKGDIHLGFNIVRTWGFGGRKRKK